MDSALCVGTHVTLFFVGREPWLLWVVICPSPPTLLAYLPCWCHFHAPLLSQWCISGSVSGVSTQDNTAKATWMEPDVFPWPYSRAYMMPSVSFSRRVFMEYRSDGMPPPHLHTHSSSEIPEIYHAWLKAPGGKCRSEVIWPKSSRKRENHHTRGRARTQQPFLGNHCPEGRAGLRRALQGGGCVPALSGVQTGPVLCRVTDGSWYSTRTIPRGTLLMSWDARCTLTC